MICRGINYSNKSGDKTINVEIILSDNIKIPESAVNKALMIAMNYLIENMETDKQEAPE